MTNLTRRGFPGNSSLGMAGLTAFGLTPHQALAARQMRFWMGLGASAGDPLIEFGMRGATEHGYDVLFDNFSNEGDTKFTAACDANDLPDMVETGYPYMGGFLDIGALDPMDDMLAAVNYPLDNVLPHILERCRRDENSTQFRMVGTDGCCSAISTTWMLQGCRLTGNLKFSKNSSNGRE